MFGKTFSWWNPSYVPNFILVAPTAQMPIAAQMLTHCPLIDELETNPPLSQSPGQRRSDPRVVPESPVDELLHLARHQAQVLEGRRIQVQKNLKRKSFKNEEALRRGSPVDRAAFKRPGSVLLF